MTPIVIDVASGMGKWGFLIKLHIRDCYLIGLDINREYVKKTKNIYDDVILADACHLPIKNFCVDVSLACEIIEHLDKAEGLKMLNELFRITKKRVIITTPADKRYFVGKKAKDIGHKTMWNPNDFRKFGFKVRGVGCRFHRKGKIMALLRHFILKPLSYVLPEMAELIIAIKEQRK